MRGCRIKNAPACVFWARSGIGTREKAVEQATCCALCVQPCLAISAPLGLAAVCIHHRLCIFSCNCIYLVSCGCDSHLAHSQLQAILPTCLWRTRCCFGAGLV